MDYTLLHLINQMAGHVSAVDSFFKLVAKYGPALYAVPLLFMWFRGGDSAKKAALLSLATMAIALLVSQLIGHVYFRPRPYDAHPGGVNLLISKSSDPSFPSDHATFSFAIAGVILLEDRRWGIASIAFGALVAFSRVFVGIHYPLDVAGGAVLGMAAAVVMWQLRKFFDPLLNLLIGIARRLKLA